MDQKPREMYWCWRMGRRLRLVRDGMGRRRKGIRSILVKEKMILSGKINDGRRSDYAQYYVDISM